MSRTRRPARTATALLVAAAGALGLAACAPAMTEHEYSPSDGVRVDLTDQLRGVNLLVVAAAQGDEGALQGALVNNTASAETFTLTAEGASPVTLTVDPSTTVYLGGEDGEKLTLDTVSQAPGAFVKATLEAGQQTKEFELPVLDGTLSEYQSLIPSPSPSPSN
ncbi:MAG: hypothetical protein FWF90_12240 [Promicromonosporaceae bacterium]|nr:hypothetical protein [Promicromonosporaceae bacterium]